MELTLLTASQVWENKLEVLKKHGIIFPITDLAILTGASCSYNYFCTPDKGRSGLIYTQSSDISGVSYIDRNGWLNFLGNYNHRYYSICPVLLSDSVFSQVFPNRVVGYNGAEEVEYGQYPQYAPDENTQKILENEYQNKNLQPTGKTYTFDDTPHKNNYKSFHDVTYAEYEYNQKKYIRVKINSHYDKVELSNGLLYRRGDYVWVEVSPVVWLIDEEKKMLISKKGILSGIRFNWIRYTFNFESTEIYHYLNNYMIKDLFQTADLKKEKANDEEVEQKEKSKIELLLNEINSYIELLPNNKLFKDKINKLINDYNEKLDRIKNEKNDVFSFETLDSITNELEMSLNMILFDLTNSSNYFDILDYINVCFSSFDEDKQEEKENETEEKDELINDLNILSNYCIPFLKEEDGNKIKEEVISIFNSEKENIERYLNNKFTNLDENDVKLNYSSKENFIIEIRKRLHPILENLVDKVSKRDIELEITSATKSIIDNTFDATKKGYLANNFKEINTITNEINSYISQVEDVNKSQEFMSKLSKVLSTEIDYTKDTKDIYKQILDIIISLHRLNLEVSEYIKEMEKINNSYIKPIK